MESIIFLHEQYQAMPLLLDITRDDMKTEHVCLAEYALWYFNTSEMDCLKLWSTVKQVPLTDRWPLSFWASYVCVHLTATQQLKGCLAKWKESKQTGEIVWKKETWTNCWESKYAAFPWASSQKNLLTPL